MDLGWDNCSDTPVRIIYLLIYYHFLELLIHLFTLVPLQYIRIDSGNIRRHVFSG